MEWYEHYNGKVYISFSGGKDSTVLLDLARRIYPDITAVFSDTGLEYPEIREFVKTFDNAIVVRPKLTFKEVIEKYGYPIIGKEVAKHVYYYKKGSLFAVSFLNGVNNDGTPSKFRSRYIKYKYLTNAPFAISHKCCAHIKIAPLKKYERETGNKPIVATMACESQQREAGWLKTGCNSFKGGKSQPMSFWTEQDILHYLKITGIPYAPIYGEIVEKDRQMWLADDNFNPLTSADYGTLVTTGCDRTGCMFCCFGINRDPTPNRFQRMKITHPKQYAYCIGGGTYDSVGMLQPDKSGLGIGEILDYIGIPY
jgi:3'-phosphoadenosine 5'-phosphosulfate sulfotransferase (PAPS reductase)/FAD synthetase